MQCAWVLHREAQFKYLGTHIFLVHFGSEGDWKHAMNNGQYDFNLMTLKDYEGNTMPFEIFLTRLRFGFE